MHRSDSLAPFFSSHLAISATQTAALRGAFAQYAFFGYKRIMQQAPYFVLPLGAGEFRIRRKSETGLTYSYINHF